MTGRTGSNESWLSVNIRPLLAVITVVFTFAVFVIFVWLSKTSAKELEAFLVPKQLAAEAAQKPTAAKKSKTDTKEPVKLETAGMAGGAPTQAGTLKDSMEARERLRMEKDFILYILGVLSAALTTVFGYYFGSSKGSAEKSAALTQIAKSGDGGKEKRVMDGE